MDIDPAFASIPKNKSCLCVWRVEVCLFIWIEIFKKNLFFLIFKKNFKLVAVPRESHGIFFKGDAYVIYHAEEIKKSTGSSSTIAPTLIQHIHFWIGSEATQDEAGVAAYKTVELGRIYSFFY
jgi:hypothetical protein